MIAAFPDKNLSEEHRTDSREAFVLIIRPPNKLRVGKKLGHELRAKKFSRRLRSRQVRVEQNDHRRLPEMMLIRIATDQKNGVNHQSSVRSAEMQIRR